MFLPKLIKIKNTIKNKNKFIEFKIKKLKKNNKINIFKNNLYNTSICYNTYKTHNFSINSHKFKNFAFRQFFKKQFNYSLTFLLLSDLISQKKWFIDYKYFLLNSFSNIKRFSFLFKNIKKNSPNYILNINSSILRKIVLVLNRKSKNFLSKKITHLKIKKKRLLLQLNTVFFSKSLQLTVKSMFFSFLSTYRFFLKTYLNDIFVFLLFKKNLFLKSFFSFYWTFTENQRLFLNFQSFKKKNFFFLTNGLFLKYFKKKKSLKKKKSIKLLMARYLRKLFLLIKFKYIIFFVKKTPSLFIEIFKILNSFIAHKFINPFIGKFYHDTKENLKKRKLLLIDYFIFYKNIDFSKNKKRKRGRLKRKVTRKLFMLDSIID